MPYNEWTGTIPSQLGDLTGIVTSNRFLAACSDMDGATTIPSQLGRLSLMTSQMMMASIGMEGTIPSEVNPKSTAS